MGTGRAGSSFQHPLLTAVPRPCLFNPCPQWGSLGLGNCPLPSACVEREEGRL